MYPEVFESTTVQFSDIEGFGDVLQAAPTPSDTIEIMNILYGTCDKVVENFDVYKIETVHDSYMVVNPSPTTDA